MGRHHGARAPNGYELVRDADSARVKCLWQVAELTETLINSCPIER
jgi:hypothetical protein